MPLRIKLLSALALLVALHDSVAANNDPLVLVHGFLGFGPEQFKQTGFKYWGGFDDIAAHMRTHGGHHTVLVAAVGPISSSWDRSAELFAQIKGGCVDYGNEHLARTAGTPAAHRAMGQCWAADPANNPQHYPIAMFPQWDAAHPIHLIGHSQGGQTIRCLIELLEHGSPYGDEGGGELYRGGKTGWVVSATTLSSPNDGTSLHDAIGNGPLLRTDGESASDFLARVKAAPWWDTASYDSVQYEMGPDGARAFNAWVRTSPNVYYYSLANDATEAGAPCCNHTDRLLAPVQDARYQYPRWDMAPLTRPYAGEWIIPSFGRHGMGAYTQLDPARAIVDASWFKNDGVVNTVSMRAPHGHPVRDYDGHSVRGSWNFLGTYHGYDHFDMVGWPKSGPRVYPIYDAIQDILYGL
ncbi:MAG: esterase/lipase family protein [Massilia sp.]